MERTSTLPMPDFHSFLASELVAASDPLRALELRPKDPTTLRYISRYGVGSLKLACHIAAISLFVSTRSRSTVRAGGFIPMHGLLTIMSRPAAQLKSIFRYLR